MNKGDWKYKLANFFQGCYGIDEFSQVLMVGGCACVLVDMFTCTAVLNLVGVAAMVYAAYRTYSKNIAARRKELNWYSLKSRKPKAWYKLTKKKWSNRKTTKYFTCDKCGQVMSVPKGVGKIRVTCPKCKDVSERQA